MDLKKLAFSLTLSASVFAGCGDDSGTTSTTSTSTNTTSTTQVIEDVGMCSDAGAAISYRITELNIPTPAQANGGETVGHNVDGVGGSVACGIPDYAGGVDNSLVDLAAALPSLAPADPIDLQEEIDNGLNCAVGATDCTRIDLIVSVRTGTGCVIVEVEDGEGANLAGPFVGSLNAAGEMRGQVSSLNLAIPYGTDTGSVDINLEVTSVIITGTRSDTTLTNVVIGGALVKSAFETTIMDLLPLLGGDISFDDISGILSNLYDVQLNGTCSALSVGLTATAEVQAAAAAATN